MAPEIYRYIAGVLPRDFSRLLGRKICEASAACDVINQREEKAHREKNSGRRKSTN